MKKWFIIIWCMLLTVPHSADAQSSDGAPGYKKKPAMPVFDIMKFENAEVVSTKAIHRGKPTVFILFMADCDHCELLADTLVMNMSRLKNLNIYMITPSTLTSIKEFRAKKNLGKYDNIVMARDHTMFFPKFFEAYDVPFIAIYDRNKQFVASFRQNEPFNKVLKAIQKL